LCKLTGVSGWERYGSGEHGPASVLQTVSPPQPFPSSLVPQLLEFWKGLAYLLLALKGSLQLKSRSYDSSS